MAAKTINGLHGRVIPCRAAIELDWVADVSSLGSLLDRLAASIDNVYTLPFWDLSLLAHRPQTEVAAPW